MKMVHVAAAAFMFALSGSALTSTAFAQAASCPVLPAPPAVPDGATAKQGEMTLANRKFTEWSTAAKASLECERSGVESMKSNANVASYMDAVAKLKATQDTADVKTYTEKVNAYNDNANKANQISEQWKTAVDAYNARQKK
jgi:hypothetical protein